MNHAFEPGVARKPWPFLVRQPPPGAAEPRAQGDHAQKPVNAQVPAAAAPRPQARQP